MRWGGMMTVYASCGPAAGRSTLDESAASQCTTAPLPYPPPCGEGRPPEADPGLEPGAGDGGRGGGPAVAHHATPLPVPPQGGRERSGSRDTRRRQPHFLV